MDIINKNIQFGVVSAFLPRIIKYIDNFLKKWDNISLNFGIPKAKILENNYNLLLFIFKKNQVMHFFLKKNPFECEKAYTF